MPQLLRMPEVAANTTEAVLASWPLQVGATFRAHDTIATVETAKAAVDIEAERNGVLLAILVVEGTEVAIGEPIALLADEGEDVADVDAAVAALGGAGRVADVAVAVPVSSNGDGGAMHRTFASPLARRLAREANLLVDDIDGSGPNSRIVRRDVEAAILKRDEPAADDRDRRPSGVAHVDRPHSRMRRAVASRLVESVTTAPHFSLRGAARVDALLSMRAQLNEDERAPTRISLTDLIVKAVAHAHLRVPEMNVIWLPDAVREFTSVDVAVAVATDNGLVTPVLRSVESLSVRAIAKSMGDLVDRSRRGALRQHELEGGTITVTNLGMYGTAEFTAIINPPQSAILAVGAVRQEPVVHDGQMRVASVLRVALSVDHRPVDGVIAARWLAEFLYVLERPVPLLS